MLSPDSLSVNTSLQVSSYKRGYNGLRFMVACISCYIHSHGDFVYSRKYMQLYETVRWSRYQDDKIARAIAYYAVKQEQLNKVVRKIK